MANQQLRLVDKETGDDNNNLARKLIIKIIR